MQQSKGKADALILSMDIIGFVMIGVGAWIVRFAKEEVLGVVGGFVMAGGVALLSITRLVRK